MSTLPHVTRLIEPGRIIGNFRVGEMLGAGGMGRVYSALDLRTQQRVALKTLLAKEQLSLDCFRREIATLSSLNLPGVVRILDHGIADGQPWYAMELLEGETLRHALRKTWPQQIPTATPSSSRTASPDLTPVPQSRRSSNSGLTARQLLAICARLLRTLQKLHSLGIVHGDLKPENIFLRDGAPVLVDFGIASSFARPREQLELTPLSIGSVSYMAPEVLRGARPDARADLYAVGCLLYECLTGKHPFRQTTLEATMLAQLNAEAPPPSSRGADADVRLDALILRMLAKSPSDRPGFASDALEIITADTRFEESVGPASGPRPEYVFRTELVGREQPLERLRELLLAATNQRGSTVVLQGQPGIGKTRLVVEAMDWAVRKHFRIIRLECVPHAQAPAFQPLRSLITSLRDAETNELNEGLDATEQALNRLCEVEGDSEEGSRRVATMRENLIQGLLTSIRHGASQERLLLAVDDLHHADDVTREFVERLARSDRQQQSLLLLCTTSDQELQTSASLAPVVETLSLEPLTEAQIGAAISAMLSMDHPTPTLVQKAYEVSEGNPFILGQYIRALIDSGVLTRSRRLGWHLNWPVVENVSSDPLESVTAQSIRSLQELFRFQWRFHELDEDALELARVAAVLGARTDIATLAAISKISEAQVTERLTALVRAQVMQSVPPAHFEFSHAFLAEVLLAEVPESRRIELHKRTAAVLTANPSAYKMPPEVLAFHLSRANAHEQAAQWYAKAADAFRRGFRLAKAIDAVSSALAELQLLPSDNDQLRDLFFTLQETRGDLALSLRRYSEADLAYQEALTVASGQPERHPRLYRKLASAHQRDSGRAAEYLNRAIEALSLLDQKQSVYKAEWLQTHLDMLWVHYWRQETKQHLELAERIREEVETHGSERQQASLHFALAVGLMQKHRYVTGKTELAHVDSALDIYENLQDSASVAMCRFLRSMILLCAGELEQAEQGFESVLGLSERAASVTIRVRALTYLCMVHRKRRAVERVRRLASAALALATEHHMAEYRGLSHAQLSWVALQDGEWGETERLADAAFQDWTKSPLNVFRWTALLPSLAAILARPEQGSDTQQLVSIADQLLSERQQQLPAPVHQTLQQLVTKQDSPSQVRHNAQQVVEAARNYALL